MITIYEKVYFPLPHFESVLKLTLLKPCSVKKLLIETGQYKEGMYVNMSARMPANQIEVLN